MTKKNEPDIQISFDLSKVDINDLYKIEKLLNKNGIHFDTGCGLGYRDWEWDPPTGPVEITVKNND